ncbi:MAG: hypothetical protein Q6363_003560 [Candidatus Njordarchaeota archaeon]
MRLFQSVAIQITPVLAISMFIGALVFGVLTRIAFGLYPAWKASKLEPV